MNASHTAACILWFMFAVVLGGCIDDSEQVRPPPENCTSPSDCARPELCLGGICTRPCASPSVCQIGLTCTDGLCLFSCDEDDDCLERLVCGSDGFCEGEAEECADDFDCDDFCDTATRTCVECFPDGDQCTGDGVSCLQGVCTPDRGRCLEDDDCPGGQKCSSSRFCRDLLYEFVLIEDLAERLSGDFPGADVDAISLIKADGREVFADQIEDGTNIECLDNRSCDPEAVLGPPDAIDPDTGVCFGGGMPDGSLLASLNGGSIVVRFSGPNFTRMTVDNGDAIRVYEVGADECRRFDDDPFRVSVLLTDDPTGDLVVLGEVGEGTNTIGVTGLP